MTNPGEEMRVTRELPSTPSAIEIIADLKQYLLANGADENEVDDLPLDKIMAVLKDYQPNRYTSKELKEKTRIKNRIRHLFAPSKPGEAIGQLEGTLHNKMMNSILAYIASSRLRG